MPTRKKKKDKDFYVKEIEVLKWLKDSGGIQIHRYKDRIEYKKDYKLHREDGPAVEYFEGVGNQYYVDGKLYSSEEYTNYRRTLLIDKITN